MNKEIEEFNKKSDLLGEMGVKFNQYDFYRYIFPPKSFEKQGCLNDKKANGIITIINGKTAYNRLIFDDLSEIENDEVKNADFAVCSPISYFGKNRTAKNSSLLYALSYDLDGVTYEDLKNIQGFLNAHAIKKDVRALVDFIFPTPTFLVNSGHGLHVYYVFDKPIPLYDCNKTPLNTFKRNLCTSIWNHYTTSKEKVENLPITQGFRMVGTPTKLGKDIKVEAYKVGDRVSIDYLNTFLNPEDQLKDLNYKSELTLENAKKMYPEWFQKTIVDKNTVKDSWHVSRALYDWWLKKVLFNDDVRVGHRYFCMCCLVAFGKKCSFYDKEKNPNPVTYKEVERDCREKLEPYFDYFFPVPYTKKDTNNALNFWQDDYITFPRKTIELLSGLEVPANRRNHRKQKDHLMRARFSQQLLDVENKTNWRKNNGRPKGSKDTKPRKKYKTKAQEKVKEYRRKYPNATKYQCAKNTKISKQTINKYWN